MKAKYWFRYPETGIF